MLHYLFIINLANKGYKKALLDDVHFRNGLNVYKGHVTFKEVAEGFNMPYVTEIGRAHV